MNSIVLSCPSKEVLEDKLKRFTSKHEVIQVVIKNECRAFITYL